MNTGSYSFPCPKCGQKLLTSLNDAGAKAVCPACNNQLIVPNKPTSLPQNQDIQDHSTSAKTQQCPFCAETIRKGAVVCRYCSREICSHDTSFLAQTARLRPRFARLGAIAAVGACLLAGGLFLVKMAIEKTVEVEVFVRTTGGNTVNLSAVPVWVFKRGQPADLPIGQNIEILIDIHGQPRFRDLRLASGFEGIHTDAQGRATLKGVRSGHFIVVSDKRQLPKGEENYFWVISASDARNGKLLLDNSNLSTAKVLNVNDWFALWSAVEDGDKNRVKVLIANGAKVMGKYGAPDDTLLHLAIEKGNKEIVEVLITEGADFLKYNKLVNLAVMTGNKEVVEVLIAKGASVNANFRHSISPLHQAIENGNMNIAELLITKGADVNSEDGNCNTPLDTAIEKGNKDITELLIASGADVNAKGSYGLTPLWRAIRKDNKNLVEVLIARGADVKKDERGWFLEEAIARGNKDIAELLITKGADVNVEFDDGSTPLHKAIARDNKDITELLKRYGAK
jgi:ankyrin repeat protein